jgi:hypothetical protein
MGNPSSSSILAVSDRGGFYSWEVLLDGNLQPFRIPCVSKDVMDSDLINFKSSCRQIDDLLLS